MRFDSVTSHFSKSLQCRKAYFKGLKTMNDSTHVTKLSEVVSAPLYVTCIDTYLSGWGPSEGLKNKLIFPCETYEEAQTVLDNAQNRTDMGYCKIKSYVTREDLSRFYAQVKTKDDYFSWYMMDYFKNDR